MESNNNYVIMVTMHNKQPRVLTGLLLCVWLRLTTL